MCLVIVLLFGRGGKDGGTLFNMGVFEDVFSPPPFLLSLKIFSMICNCWAVKPLLENFNFVSPGPPNTDWVLVVIRGILSGIVVVLAGSLDISGLIVKIEEGLLGMVELVLTTEFVT